MPALTLTAIWLYDARLIDLCGDLKEGYAGLSQLGGIPV